MKKFIFITVLILISGFTFGQTLKKRTVLGIHTSTFVLYPDAILGMCKIKLTLA